MSNQNSNQPRGSSTNKMLIDATHPEETRVVVQRNGRVEEFDFESAARKLLRGNIYLAKVTRVEPSLQAAFVDYGGNRHGFLAFNEIHPDYYQIPVADRRALIEAENAAEAEEEAAADRAAEYAESRRSRRRGRHGPGGSDRPAERDGAEQDGEDGAVDVSSMLPAEPAEPNADRGGDQPGGPALAHPDDHRDAQPGDQPRSVAERTEPDATVSAPAHSTYETGSEQGHNQYESRREAAASVDQLGDQPLEARGEREASEPGDRTTRADDAGEPGNGDSQIESVDAANGAEAEQIETVSANEDVLEEVPMRPRRRLRSYKIQEVIKRRQVLLVQVVKEERGTKGAALTTYLSLAGRYTVLMPNTARGGGISRKITNPQDRKRLKAIAAELDVPEGMGLIIRTAGAARTKQEIKRDYEYLLRLWESVRELALGSNAPALVYEEGNLIKRSIRDLYGKEVEEIIVAGEGAYKEAKDFMRMLMPSHAKNVLFYQDPEPLFTRFGMERQLGAMFSPYVHLRSGGYLVINQTEALVAIDINSGKSTREFSIEETAYSTNMEAADEIARQLKLRDLAGLIVIDFIDMEEKRNNRAVERRLKDALRQDRARIQLGRISHFGLLEMSRQRMRTGVLEGSTTQCPHCQGTGIIRSTESVALAVLRGLEDALMAGHPSSLVATTTATVALYILNNKRAFITDMEARNGITVQIQASEKMQGANFSIEKQARRDEPQRRPERAAVNMDWGFEDDDAEAPADGEIEMIEDVEADDPAGEEGGREEGGRDGGDGRRRRRRRRGRRGEPGADQRQPRAMRHGEAADAPPGYRESDEQPFVGDDRPRTEAAFESNGDEADDADQDDAVVEAGADDRGGQERREGGDDQNGERRSRRRRRGRRGGRRGQERDAAEGGAMRTEGGEQPATGREEAGSWDRPQATAEDQPQPHVHAEPAAWQPVYVEPPASPSYPGYSSSNGWSNGNSSPRAEPVAQDAPPPTSADSAAEPVAVAPPVIERPAPQASPEPQPVPEPQPAPQPVPTPRSAPVASEPVLERVVVGGNAGATVEPAEARPARRGWWQRK